MPELKRKYTVGAIVAAMGALSGTAARADYIDDSHLTLGLRNFWVDRDYKQDNAPKSRTGSWSQGFDLQFVSGYTEGPVKFGLDVGGQFAYRLDGSTARATDGVLPVTTDGSPVDDYGHANATAKMRFSNTELKIGDMRPNLPVATYDPTRQLMTTYQGALLESKEVKDLTLTAGRFWSITGRESSNSERIYLWGDNPSMASSGLNFAGASYNLTPNLTGTYFYGVLTDIYRQHYAGITYKVPLGDGYTLKTDARYFNTREEGEALSGRVDNRTYGTMFSLNKGGHTFGLGYQRMMGQDTFPTFNSYAPAAWLINWSALGFVKPGERSWQARYDYDFAAAGVPGLKWMARWMEGNDINLGVQSHETERTSIVSYTVQDGAFKGFGAMWMNIGVNTRDSSAYEENRLILTYSLKIW
ncbi:OprD family porin [Pseudomonas capsici]|uniref:OprD family porin n=1 Tax=Pseudomonas capsici TaxID=2810614 RepID=UPI0021F1FF2E|nr:OprD family porin [Pseudomonas capsici]MCV4285530.1 OprD family porin [Pseudomonas capsici]